MSSTRTKFNPPPGVSPSKLGRRRPSGRQRHRRPPALARALHTDTRHISTELNEFSKLPLGCKFHCCPSGFPKLPPNSNFLEFTTLPGWESFNEFETRKRRQHTIVTYKKSENRGTKALVCQRSPRTVLRYNPPSRHRATCLQGRVTPGDTLWRAQRAS